MSSSPPYHRDLMEAVVGLRPPSELDRMAQDAKTNGPNDPDPEHSYLQGTMFAYGGKKDAAFRMLKAAIEQNYCAYSNLLSDPLLRALHPDQKFDDLLTAAHECRYFLGPHAREDADPVIPILKQASAEYSLSYQD